MHLVANTDTLWQVLEQNIHWTSVRRGMFFLSFFLIVQQWYEAKDQLLENI